MGGLFRYTKQTRRYEVPCALVPDCALYVSRPCGLPLMNCGFHSVHGPIARFCDDGDIGW